VPKKTRGSLIINHLRKENAKVRRKSIGILLCLSSPNIFLKDKSFFGSKYLDNNIVSYLTSDLFELNNCFALMNVVGIQIMNIRYALSITGHESDLFQ